MAKLEERVAELEKLTGYELAEILHELNPFAGYGKHWVDRHRDGAIDTILRFEGLLEPGTGR